MNFKICIGAFLVLNSLLLTTNGQEKNADEEVKANGNENIKNPEDYKLLCSINHYNLFINI
jgi:hypothetical protein